MKCASLWLAAVLIALSTAAQSQVCDTTCSRYEEGQCVEHMQRCTTPGSGSSSNYSYGAIAYSPKTGESGYSYSYGSRARAEREAMSECVKSAKDCEIAVWFENKCGAVSADPGPTEFWAVGDTDAQARSMAQQKCMVGGRKGCKIMVSRCSKR